MITILVGTNRPEAKSGKIAHAILQVYQSIGVAADVMDLADFDAKLIARLNDQVTGFADFVAKLK